MELADFQTAQPKGPTMQSIIKATFSDLDILNVKEVFHKDKARFTSFVVFV